VNRSEFEKEVMLNQEPLRRFLYNLCNGDAALGDDIAQEAFIKAYINLSSFSGKSKFSTWLFRIAYNCFCDNKRAAKKYTSSELNDNIAVEHVGADAKYKNQELYMAMPENTIKSHLSRARGNLSNHLNRIGYER